MALSVTRQDLFGNSRVVVAVFTFDASYATSGEACDPGLGTINIALSDPSVSGYVFQYDYTNKKLKAFYADYDAGADGPLIEVANGTNLSSVSVRLVFIGA
ncbi:MAG: hypothetical protein CV087_20840 [Candidatus Brocadia sp. WS118]|nr:MAG: hypothetical protein CV087_20840 [Candidatus Brocadia sp. WS118]